MEEVKDLKFELAHFGINSSNKEEADKTVELLSIFGLKPNVGPISTFMDTGIEVMNTKFFGKLGHIGFRCNNIPKALEFLKEKGFTPNMESIKYKENGEIQLIYFNEEISGFAVHLVAAK